VKDEDCFGRVVRGEIGEVGGKKRAYYLLTRLIMSHPTFMRKIKLGYRGDSFPKVMARDTGEFKYPQPEHHVGCLTPPNCAKLKRPASATHATLQLMSINPQPRRNLIQTLLVFNSTASRALESALALYKSNVGS